MTMWTPRFLLSLALLLAIPAGGRARAADAAAADAAAADAAAADAAAAEAAAAEAAAAEALVVEELMVVLIDAVNVPARQVGAIAQIAVREGDSVQAGQRLAMLDDRKANLEQALARTQLEIARQRASHGLGMELATKKLAEQQQLARQHEIAREIAARKAENEVRVLASKKAEGVAKNELDRALRARQEYVDSVSRSEIDGLQLAYERTRLETQQADFERRLDVLLAKSEDEAAAGHLLSVERLQLEVAQAASEQRVQELQSQLQQQQAELAEWTTLQHTIVAPFSGVVVERFRNQGDWVAPGDAVVRVIRLDRLRAEGFVPAGQLSLLRRHRDVELTIAMAGEDVIRRDGEIVFISPEIDPVNDEVRFWVEFENPGLEVLPGTRVSLRSKP
jgi:multidrug efflux pump subunit AcrA (membrane-fusion protein)